MVLHNPEVQHNVLKEEISVIMEELSKEEIEGLIRLMQIHKINSNEGSTEEIFPWVRSIRVFKSRARKSECHDVRNMLNVIVN